MSSIDERIVRMTFDNQKFMEKAKQTIQVLSNLKSSLKLDKVQGAFDDINKSAKNFNLNVIESGLNTIANRFTNLGVIGTTVLSDLTRQALHAGQSLVKSFTIDPIKTGFQEYETQINAVQTILANTESKGGTLKDVNAALDELNKYADMTIYNFTEMTRNIGTFTAAGVDLDTSVAAIKGIANLAAVSGSTSQQASTAMYQLSQALASGTVKLMDWNSVVNAGMGGQVFQDALEETARVHGIAIDDMIKKEGSFRETLSSGWLTSSILTETLQKFTGDLSEAQLKQMGYSEEQTQAILKMGETANNAATKVKTFTQLMDTLSEAAQSGWTSSWETIIGDFEEAKEFLTYLSDTFSEVINASAEARNSVLTGWKDLGGRDMLIESLKNALEAINAILKPIREAFAEVIPPVTAETLVSITQGLKDFTQSLIVSARTAENIKNVFKAIFSVFKVAGSVVMVTFKAFSMLVSVAVKLIDILLYPIGDVARIFSAIVNTIYNFIDGFKKLITTISQLESVQMLSYNLLVLFESIQNLLYGVYDAFRSLVFIISDTSFDTSALIFSKIADAISFVAQILNDVIIKVVRFVGALKDLPFVQETISKISVSLNTLRTNVSNVASVVGTKLVSAFKKVSVVLKGFAAQLLPVLKETGGKIKDFIVDIMTDGIPLSENIKEIFGNIVEKFKEITAVKFEDVVNRIRSIKDRIKEVTNLSENMDRLKGGFSSAGDAVSGFLGTTGGALTQVKDKVMEFVNWAKTKLGNISLGDILAAGVGGSFIALTYSLTKFTNSATKAVSAVTSVINATAALPNSLANLVNSYSNLLKAKTKSESMNAVANLIKSVVLLAGALVILSKTDQDAIRSSAIVLGALAGGLILLTTVSAKLISEVDPAVIAAVSTMMITASAAMFVLALSLKKISDIDSDKIVTSLIAMGVMMGELAAFTIVVSKFAPEVSTGAVSMIAMALALTVLARAMKSIGDISANQILAAISILTVLGGLLVAMNKFSSNKSTAGSALKILAVAGSLLLMIEAMKKLAELDPEIASTGIKRLVELISAIAILFIASSVAGKHAIGAGVAVLAVSAALTIISDAIKKLAEIDQSTMDAAGNNVKQILLVFAVITASTAIAGKYAARAGASIAMMSASMLLIVAAIAVLSKLDPEGVERGVDAVQRIMLMFALIVAATSNAKDAQKTITVMAVTIGALAAGLAVLSLLNPENLKAASEAISLVMGSFALIVASTSLIEKGAGMVALMIVVVGSMAVCLRMLAKIPVENALAASASLSLLMVSFSGALFILQHVDPMAAIKGVAGLIAVLGILATFMGLLAGIQELSGGTAASFLQNGIPMLEAIATGIGTFVGSLAGALVGSFSGSALEVFGTSLSNFMTNIQGFLDGAKNIDQSSVDGVGSLVSMLLMLTGAEFLNNIAGLSKLLGGNIGGFLSGKSGLESLADDMVDFADIMGDFVDKTAKLNDGDLEKSMKAVEAISKIPQMFTAEGGVEGFIHGSGSEAIYNLSIVLPGLAYAMADYSKALAKGNIDYDAISRSIEPVKTLFTLLDVIKEEGGIADFIEGSSSEAMKNLSRTLPALGKALVSYSKSVSSEEINYDAIAASIEPTKQLFTLLDAIKDEGGVVDWWGGSSSEAIGNLANRLEPLGKGIKAYSDSVASGVDWSSVTASIEPLKKFFEILNYIKDEGGVVDWWNGSSSEALGNLANTLEPLGDGLKSYSDSISGVSIENLKTSFEAVSVLVDVTQKLDDENFLSFLTGNNSTALANIATVLPLVGAGLTAYSATLGGANFDLINTSLDAVGTIVDIANKLGDESILDVFVDGTKGGALTNLSTSLPALGLGLKGYADNLVSCNFELIDSSLDAVDTIAGLAEVLDKEGGVLSFFGGTKSEALENFASQLGVLGGGLSAYSYSLGNFNTEKAQAAAETLKTLSEISASMNNEGGIKGVFDKIFGDKGIDDLEGLDTNFKNLASCINTFADEVNIDKIASLPDSMGKMKGVVDFVKSLDGINTEAVGNFKSALTEAGDLGIPGFANSIEGMGDKLTNDLVKIKNSLEMTVPDITAQVTSLKDSLSSKELSLSTEGRKTATTFTDSFKLSLTTGINNASNPIVSAVTSVYNKIKGVFSSSGAQFYAIGSGIANSLKTGISSISFSGLGHDMMSGLASGISSNSYIAKNAASRAASDALKAAKNALDSQSPSRKFMKLGEDSDKGLAIGIDRYSNVVKEAGKNLGEEALAGAKNTIKLMSELDDVDLNSSPEISPVIDMSNVEKGVKRVNSYLGGIDSIKMNATMSTKMSANTSDAIRQGDINRELARYQNNAEIVSAIYGLQDTLLNNSGSHYVINGVTYDDGTGIQTAVGELIDALTLGERM